LISLEFFGVTDGARTHDNRNHNPVKGTFIDVDQHSQNYIIRYKSIACILSVALLH